MTTDWHLDDGELDQYARGLLQAPSLWSVEAHLAECPLCRRQLGGSAIALATERVWRRLDDALDQPRTALVERVLLRTGVPEHIARLLAATPALRLSWLGAVATTLALGVGASWFARSLQTPLLLLALVPLLAVAGVAAAFGPRVDPTYEIGLVAPFDTFRLVLLRTSATLTVTVLLAGTATIAAPEVGLRAVAWLAPALLLTGISLALSSVFDPVPAAGVTAITWLLVLAGTTELSSGISVLFTPSAQAGMGAAAVLAAFAVAATRWRFDTSRTFDTSRRLY